MTKYLIRLALSLLAAAALTVPVEAATYLRVQSWNCRHMGWSGQTDWSGYANQIWKTYGNIPGSPTGLDVVALQEVTDETSVKSMVTALESVSRYDWDATYTAPLGRSTYKERYAILWRTDRLRLLSAYTYDDVGDRFEREPLVARFRVLATGADVTFIDWHTVFGTTALRQQEIKDIASVFGQVQDSSGLPHAL